MEWNGPFGKEDVVAVCNDVDGIGGWCVVYVVILCRLVGMCSEVASSKGRVE